MSPAQGVVYSFFLAVFSTAAVAARHPAPTGQPEAGGILRQFTVASFAATGETSIQATAVDAFGNIFVADAPPVHRIFRSRMRQPAFGDGRVLRSMDLGATWQPLATRRQT
jgi:hypothetical protein